MEANDCAVREFDLGEGHTLRVKEFTLLQDEAGAVVWDAGLVLAYYLAHQHACGRSLLRGRTVLELGSGTGAVGLAAARLGARAVWLSDLPHLIPYLRENIQLNGLGAHCSALPLEWANAAHLTAARAAELRRPPDVLLAADTVYTAEGRRALFATLTELLRPPAAAAAAATAVAPAGAPAAPAHGGATDVSEPGCEGLAEGQERLWRNGDGLSASVQQDDGACGKDGEARCRNAAGVDTGGSDGGGNGGDGGDGGGSGDHAGGSGGSEDGPVAYLCFEERPGVEELPGLCAQHGLHAEEVPMDELHPSWRSEDIHILRLRYRGCT